MVLENLKIYSMHWFLDAAIKIMLSPLGNVPEKNVEPTRQCADKKLDEGDLEITADAPTDRRSCKDHLEAGYQL